MAKTKHRGTSVLFTRCLAVVMAVGLILALPAAAKADSSGNLAGVPVVVGMAQTPATGASAGGPGTDETSQVGFGGYSWYVIGFDGTGVASAPGTITLIEQGRYTTTRQFSSLSNNEYGNSLLLDDVTDAFNSGIAFTVEEKGWMIPRTLDEVAGAAPTGQKLWALSGQEALNISHRVREGATNISARWWLRSPSTYTGVNEEQFIQYVTNGGVVVPNESNPSLTVGEYRSVRVAFQLDLTDLLFVSLANGNDKNAFVPDAILPAIVLPAGVGSTTAQMMKLTMKTTALELQVSGSSVNGDRIDFSYTTTGAYDRLSAIVRAADGSIKNYGMLDDATAPNASVQIPANLSPGDNLEVFVEVVNGASVTDLASAP